MSSFPAHELSQFTSARRENAPFTLLSSWTVEWTSTRSLYSWSSSAVLHCRTNLRTCTCKQLHKTANQQSSGLNISLPSKDYFKENTLEQLIFPISEPCAVKSRINLILDYILSCFSGKICVCDHRLFTRCFVVFPFQILWAYHTHGHIW